MLCWKLRSTLPLLLVVGLLPLAALGVDLSAQPSPTARTPVSPVAAEQAWAADSLAVARASAAWMRALQRGDTSALDTLMAPDYRLSGPTNAGVGVDKATWIRNAQTIVATDSASYPVMGFRAIAPGVALGSGILYWRTRVRGWPIPLRQYAVTDVWVRRDGRWQIVARDADFAPQAWRRIGAVGGALGMGAVLGLVWLVQRWRRRAAPRRVERAPGVGTTAPLT